jgi:hypothetical protein
MALPPDLLHRQPIMLKNPYPNSNNTERNEQSRNDLLCVPRRASAYGQPLSALLLTPLTLTSCSGRPRACIRSAHTRHRHAPFRAAAARTRAQLHTRSGNTSPSRTQTQSSVSRPTASAGVGVGAAPAVPAGAVLRGYRYPGVPFCCGSLPPQCFTIPVPSPTLRAEQKTRVQRTRGCDGWAEARFSPGLGKEHEEEGQ